MTSAQRSAPVSAAPSNMVKTTMPTPSLNRLSPATVAWSEEGTFSSLSTPSTETGSVGEISAPKTKYQIGSIGRPISRPKPQVSPPTTTVGAGKQP